MRVIIKKLFNAFGFDITRVSKTQFSINGIKYVADPCSVGHEIYGEITAKGAISIIKERDLKGLKILDIGCGVGTIGLTIFSSFGNSRIIKNVVFSDINIFNINSLKKTISLNKLDHLLDSKFRIYLSDCLTNIPSFEKFDLIISNPPYYPTKSFSTEKLPLTPGRLGTYDGGWDFHRKFYSQCHNYLNDRGEVWFLENGSVAGEKEFLPFIENNDKIKYVKGIKVKRIKEQIKESLPGDLFWMITQKA